MRHRTTAAGPTLEFGLFRQVEPDHHVAIDSSDGLS
jgi:hypothetical protein